MSREAKYSCCAASCYAAGRESRPALALPRVGLRLRPGTRGRGGSCSAPAPWRGSPQGFSLLAGVVLCGCKQHLPAAVTSQHFVSPSVPAVGLSLLASRQHLPPPMALCPRVLPRQDFQGLYLKPSSVRLTIRGLPDGPMSDQ